VGPDEKKIEELYTKKAEGEDQEIPKGSETAEDKKNAYINFHFMDDNDIKTEPHLKTDPLIE